MNKIHPTVTLYLNTTITESSIGEHSSIGDFSRIISSNLSGYNKIDRNSLMKGVTMGEYTYTGPFCICFNVNIGKFSSISYGVTIGPPEHEYKRMSTHPFIHDSYYGIFDPKTLIRNDKFDLPVEVGHDVWIGCNATILRGVKIGNGAVIGANALVDKDVPDYAVVAGCPAKVINYRFKNDIIKLLNRLEWWNRDIDWIRRHSMFFTDILTEGMILKLLTE